MIYTAIDNFYLDDEQLTNSPSRKDGIDEVTEMTLRVYGCDLVQESGILLRLPQAVMATGQVLFHRFFCKKSFSRFNVKRVAASCVWLASKLEESPKKARQVLNVFHRMECRRENLPVEHLDLFSKKYSELKNDLNRTERHLLKEMGFICHVEHPHKFISNYLATLGAPSELRQEAWNLANDSLRTTLCVRFKSEVVACGVVYAAARRFRVPLPENPPWWKVFDAEKHQIDEVCMVLARLYQLPKAQFIPVCKEGNSFTAMMWDSRTQQAPKSTSQSGTPADIDTITPKSALPGVNVESGGSKGVLIKAALEKLKDSKKSDDDSNSMPIEEDVKEDAVPKSRPELKTESNGDRNRDRERDREKKRLKVPDRDRGRDSDRERERELSERDKDKLKDRGHRSKERGKEPGGYTEKSKHQSSRDRDYHNSSYSSRDKDRHRHHSYA